MSHDVALLPFSASDAHRATLSGLLLAMYPLGQFLGAPVMGRLSDQYGRKPVLSVSLFLAALGFCGMGIAIAFNQFVGLLLCCFLTGLCESNMAIAQSVIAGHTDQQAELRTKLIGYAYSAASLGFTLSPLFVGFMMLHWGYSTPCFITAIGVLLLLAWVIVDFASAQPPLSAQPLRLLQAFSAMKTLVTQRHLRRFYVINFVIFFAVQGLYRVMPIYIFNTWHVTMTTYTFIIAYVSLICLLSNLLLTGRLAARFSSRSLLIGLALCGGSAIILMVIPHAFKFIWLTYGLAVIPTVIILAVSTAWLSQQATQAEQGQALGNNQSLMVLGEASSAAFGGTLAAVSVTLPAVLMGVLLLIVAAIVWYLPQQQPAVELSFVA